MSDTAESWRAVATGERRSRRRLLFGALAAIVILAIAFAGLGIMLRQDVAARRFNPDRWRAEPRQRWQMVDDLGQRRLLQHDTRGEVQQLLGKPYDQGKDWIRYDLGESNWLFVFFGTDGRVSELREEWD